MAYLWMWSFYWTISKKMSEIDEKYLMRLTKKTKTHSNCFGSVDFFLSNNFFKKDWARLSCCCLNLLVWCSLPNNKPPISPWIRDVWTVPEEKTSERDSTLKRISFSSFVNEIDSRNSSKWGSCNFSCCTSWSLSSAFFSFLFSRLCTPKTSRMRSLVSSSQYWK